jgi:hypothetical protein
MRGGFDMRKYSIVCLLVVLLASLAVTPQMVQAHFTALSITITGPTPSSFAPEDGESTQITFTPSESGYYSWSYDSNPHMYYWTSIGHGPTAWIPNLAKVVD